MRLRQSTNGSGKAPHRFASLTLTGRCRFADPPSLACLRAGTSGLLVRLRGRSWLLASHLPSGRPAASAARGNARSLRRPPPARADHRTGSGRRRRGEYRFRTGIRQGHRRAAGLSRRPTMSCSSGNIDNAHLIAVPARDLWSRGRPPPGGLALERQRPGLSNPGPFGPTPVRSRLLASSAA